MLSNITNILISLLIFYILIFIVSGKENKQKNLPYYEVEEIEPKLNTITKIKHDVLEEVKKIHMNDNKWKIWPEKELYKNTNGWKIFPFYAFGIWVEENCEMCPVLANFVRKIPNLKLATLSRLSAGTILNPHQGWHSHSNSSIRCHYGLIVPNNCYIKVFDDVNKRWIKKYHNTFEWLIFDDAKLHNAENLSNKDRIILIVDVERPADVEKGKSEIGDSNELLQIIDYFKNRK